MQNLLTWLEFLEDFNGVSAFRIQRWQDNDALELSTDTAASIVFGGYIFQWSVVSRALALLAFPNGCQRLLIVNFIH